MRVLITAGGTTEKIDEVRAITNHSTGRLGSLIADYFYEAGATEIVYICSEQAKRPTHIQKMRELPIVSVQELYQTLTKELISSHFDIVIHSMAVSDYYLEGTASQDVLTTEIVKQLNQHSDMSQEEAVKQGLELAFHGMASANQPKKMSSALPTVYFQLKQTPKVIRQIKKIQPNATLVGFKLLVDVDSTELVQVASRLMEKNDADYVLANDLSQIKGDHHVGYLLQQDGSYTIFQTKQEIAKGIVETTMKGVN